MFYLTSNASDFIFTMLKMCSVALRLLAVCSYFGDVNITNYHKQDLHKLLTQLARNKCTFKFPERHLGLQRCNPGVVTQLLKRVRT